MKTEIQIKPLSVNSAWRGRRFKTSAYEAYETELFYKLPPLKIPEGDLYLNVQFGLSSANSDLDNCLKQFIDCLSKKYLFNDRNIIAIYAVKQKVKKGAEHIKFELLQYKIE